MKSSFLAKRLSYIPLPIPWQICLILSSIIPMMFVVSPARTQTIAQAISGSSVNRPILKVGSQGESVSELQGALKLLGFYTGKVDGKYDNSTASAVSKFKQAVGLKPDGIVDANTWRKLFPSQQVQVSTQQNSSSRVSVVSRTVTTKPEPRPAKPKLNTTANNTKPEPRPAKPKLNTTTNNTKPEPRPAKPKPKPKPKPNTTASNRKKPTQKQTSSVRVRKTTGGSRSSRSRRVSRNRAIQKRKVQRNRKIFGASRNPSLQYTAQGLPILRQGAKGSEVVTLQTRLKKQGFLKGNVDGDFGQQTLAAVKAFQKRYGLEDDGVVGGATWRVLLRR